MAKMNTKKIGGWAFILGVLIAVIAGVVPFGPYAQWISAVLVVLGLVVGFLNISSKEVNDFLIAAIALTTIAVSSAGLALIPAFGGFLAAMVNYIAVFVAPAALVVALKSIYEAAKISK
jgi:hypothetical protein